MKVNPEKLALRQRRAKRPSVIDVARAASVSSMTVSNVVNGRYERMSKATRLKVEEAIEQLGYRPQTTGRSLRLAQRFLIGMIVVDESPTFLADPFITQLVAGLSNYLSKRDYALVIQAVSGRDFGEASPVRRSETDALCLLLSGSPRQRRKLLHQVAAIDHPLVLFQEKFPPSFKDAVSIRQDDFGGGKALAELLLKQGARDLLFLIPGLPWPAVEQRELGIRRAVAEFKSESSVSVLSCGTGSLAEVSDALDGYSRHHSRPDALMGANDQIGIAAMKWLQRKGLNVPGDAMVTGFNAFEFWGYSEPVLTTVRSPAYEMGARGGALLLERLQHDKFPRRDDLFDVKLQIGGST